MLQSVFPCQSQREWKLMRLKHCPPHCGWQWGCAWVGWARLSHPPPDSH